MDLNKNRGKAGVFDFFKQTRNFKKKNLFTQSKFKGFPSNFMLTYGGHLRYNLKLQGISPKGGTFYAENLSAEEAPQKKGAWFPEENVRSKRT